MLLTFLSLNARISYFSLAVLFTGRTALHIAIENENIEMVELLLLHNAEVGDSLLHAINEENVEAVELILIHEENRGKPLDKWVRDRPNPHRNPYVGKYSPVCRKSAQTCLRSRFQPLTTKTYLCRVERLSASLTCYSHLEYCQVHGVNMSRSWRNSLAITAVAMK